jgi:3-deoxy-D-manno-octulosonate 8-phosphate phosphatase (KDO 8-P phosphatase)
MMKPPYNISDTLYKQIKTIKVALFDVDGVLTDGSLYFDANGEVLKQFNALDGHGLKMLQASGVEVGIISARQSSALNARLNNLGIHHQLTGISNKTTAMNELLEKLNFSAENTCFTGDDVIDKEVMQACGLSFSVENGHYSAKEIADWVTPMKGGEGAVRAICDVLLYAQSI